MTLDKAKAYAKEIANRYGFMAYVHTSEAVGYNFRFLEPIETVDAGCQTVESFDPETGEWTVRKAVRP